MKLKTLKDLEEEIGTDEEAWKSHGLAFVKELKAEVVKWVKELGVTTEDENTEENVAISSWIIHFFNITEEDLK